MVESLHNVEDVPPSETGSSRNLVVLGRRIGTEKIFAALDDRVTYRVNAARAQSHLRRFMAISRDLTMDEIDDEAWDKAKNQIVEWMAEQIKIMKSAGQFDAVAQSITRVGLKTLSLIHI